jgi:catechol 2,3-dioxygenase-like lactoylglutathione lyase family enzyme
MIKGVHAMFYSSEAEALRSFFHEKLGLPSTDIGAGWLVFALPEAELGIHVVDLAKGRPSGTHLLSFYCDDIQATFADLEANGVEFVGDIRTSDWGYATRFRAPGGIEIDLYQPRYENSP